MSPSPPGSDDLPVPAFLARAPVALRFGTSGLRGLVRDMSDLEVYVNTRGFLRFLVESGAARPGGAVAMAEDLRATDPSTGLESSPRIARAVARAVRDAGFSALHCGRVPTPALACFAMHEDAGKQAMPCIMVTGSHIPADRNGIKFYGGRGEVLKEDEAGILAAVAACRAEEYARDAASTPFDAHGMFRAPPPPEQSDPAAERCYVQRYIEPFAGRAPLRGLRVVHYQHTAVGRDVLARILSTLGAEVIPEGRSEAFVPIDTEDVTAEDEARYRRMVTGHGGHALVSTDGDGDRPLIVDETGRFHRGDMVGLVTAEVLGARFAAVPMTVSDALDLHLAARAAPMEVARTRIGSPYVIAAMQRALAAGRDGVVGWEANGGFLTGSPVRFGNGTLAPLPTRDAALPILAVILAAAERGVRVSEIFAALPQRATRAGLIDEFPRQASDAILAAFHPGDAGIRAVRFSDDGTIIEHEDGRAQVLAGAGAHLACRDVLGRYFTAGRGFGAITGIDYTDGVRVRFAGGDIAHLRPSGNAPQLRIYAVSDSQERADAIVAMATAEPDGLLRRMARELG